MTKSLHRSFEVVEAALIIGSLSAGRYLFHPTLLDRGMQDIRLPEDIARAGIPLSIEAVDFTIERNRMMLADPEVSEYRHQYEGNIAKLLEIRRLLEPLSRGVTSNVVYHPRATVRVSRLGTPV